MREEKSVVVALIEAAATVGSTLVIVYYTDAKFRYEVDQVLGELRYRVKHARWSLWWRSLPGWRQERYEEKHGPQEA